MPRDRPAMPRDRPVMPRDLVGPQAVADPSLRKRLFDGFAHLKAGELQAARATFSKVIETQPELSTAHLGLGWVYFQEQDMQAALQCFQNALALNPKSMRATALIARVREKLGD